MRTNQYLLGVILCLIATISWGVMFPIMTHALEKMDPFTFTAVRFSIICLMFVIYLYYKEGATAFKLDGNILLLWILGSIGFAGFGFLVFLGQKLAGSEGALNASIMLATMPLLGLLIAWALQGMRPAFSSFLFVTIAFVGVLLVITKGDTAFIDSLSDKYLADLFMIAGPICWVMYTMGTVYFPHWSPLKYTTLSTMFGLITIYAITLLLIMLNIVQVPSVLIVMQTIPELLYMSLVAGFIGFLCWNHGNRIISPVNGVVFMALVPVTSFFVSTLEGIVPTAIQVLGVGLTAIALIFNNIAQRRKLSYLS